MLIFLFSGIDEGGHGRRAVLQIKNKRKVPFRLVRNKKEGDFLPGWPVRLAV
ncbi:hypothetical protein FXV91_12965 [Methanosarcina sp. DH2]|jgi:hypothetical protein|uniref:hypothetical protein n=1 Tax=Methanosarcina sp. DH2 TaxID=2605639 RepID=UPI001E4A7856|nr:hypothetical protein [Methanosarcina sp. DH2]MCC4771045.1 hypothetical protein [Methanosarcina sp. DH2]